MTAPQHLPYTIVGRELVAQIPGMRVQILALGKGETFPWHYHTEVHDIFICIDGITIVETRAPRATHELLPGEHCTVAPGTAHEVSGKDGKTCSFTIVQGVGEHDYHQIGP